MLCCSTEQGSKHLDGHSSISLVMIPLLVYLGIPVKYAIAASMVSIIATSSGSAASYVKDKLANVKVAMYLEMFTIVGAIIGASITSVVEPRLLYFFFAAFLSTSLKKRKEKKMKFL